MCTDERGRAPVAPPSFGVTWGGLPMHARRLMTVAAATAITVGVAGPAVAEAATPSAAAPVSVVVREAPGAGSAAQQAVADEAVRALIDGGVRAQHELVQPPR